MLPGKTVRLKSDPSQQGILTDKVRCQGDVKKYQVQIGSSKSYFPEYELVLVDDDPSDWTELLELGRFGRVRDLRRNITHIHLSGRLANLVYSMDATNIDFYAYQYKPVLSFLDSPSNGILIADEVGLGKTIEAGLIWTELRARYDTRRLLVVCPAMLREKWCSELNSRFGVDAEIMDAAELLQHLKKKKHELPEGKGIVCSLQGLRPPSRYMDEETRGARADLARFLDHQADEEPIIDLVIIDEAHYLRNPESQSAKFGQLVRGVADNVVLLSATPINLHSDDLFYLLRLVDPDSFGVKEVFPQVLNANEHLIRARELALDMRVEGEDILRELMQAKKNPLLANSVQLDELVKVEFSKEFLAEKSERIRIANRIERVNLLRHVITRTRKSEVHEWQVVREPVKKFIDLDIDGPEWNFYVSVTETIRRYALEADISDGFLLAGPQRQVSSCMYAAANAWRNRKEASYEQQVFEDLGIEVDSGATLSPLLDRLRTEVLPQVNLEELRANDSKYNVFVQTLRGYIEEHPQEKLIVFSFFRGTLVYLAERLAYDGIESQVLVGGMKETKQDVIEAFRKNARVKVLLSSEVASEGVDLQFCRVLVNYDLPWNPMKVEQRIGRIDRLGQEAEKISIINLLYAGTIDHKIHERLYARLRLFERALGGMDAILGEQIADLTSDLLRRPLTEEQVSERVERTALAIERIKLDQDELERQASHLIAHGGHILEEVEAAQQFKKRITEHDLISYAKDYLDKYCQGFDFRQMKVEEPLFDIRFPADQAALLDEFIRKNKLHGRTRLATGEAIRCRFANKVRRFDQREEIISQFHPLIRFISEQLIKKNENFFPLVAVRLSRGENVEVSSGQYVFSVARWVFSGLKTEEELAVRVVAINTGELLSRDDSWALVNLARIDGSDWREAGENLNLDDVRAQLDRCNAFLDSDFQWVKAEKLNENADRVALQIESAERHRDRHLSSHEKTLASYQAEGRRRMIPATLGRIQKVKERFALQEQKLKQRSELKSSPYEVCCGVILVE